MSLAGLIGVAKGEQPADLLLVNARIVNTLNGAIEYSNVAIHQDRIAGIGDYTQARNVVDLEGRYLAPGLIDGHTHIESSYLNVAEYARAVVPRGTTSVVTDLHEIANVCGLRGVKYILNAARRVPLDVFLMAPPCVPATRLETSGAEMGAGDLRSALKWREARGVGEFMDFPGVLSCDPQVLEKLALSSGAVVDGHAPRLKGKDLNAYVAAGIHSDHESTSLDEAREKLSRGMHLMIRAGPGDRDLETLLPLVTDETYPRCSLVIDDRNCADLLRYGDMDSVVRKAVSLGLAPVRAIQMASLNTALYLRLGRVGAVAPGYLANLVALNDLSQFRAEMVFWHGEKVAEGGKPLFAVRRPGHSRMNDTMHVRPFDVHALGLPSRGALFPVIELVPGQILTRRVDLEPKVENGLVVADTSRDLLKLVVVERHKATGNIGRGLVRGLGLARGAMASSIAHDSHNIVAAGAADEDLFLAVKQVERLGGGLAVAGGGQVLSSLALPVGGLLSRQSLEHVVSRLEMLESYVMRLGCRIPSPFTTLSFLALPVIPQLRLTDLGLVDVEADRVLPIR